MAQVHTVVPDDVFKRARIVAIKGGMVFKQWVAKAIEEKTERDERKAAK
jgi:hypothetical protein